MSMVSSTPLQACCLCCLKPKKKCPDVVSPTEPPFAEELRTIMSGNILLTDSGEAYTFINKLTKYPMDTCMNFEVILSEYFCPIPLEALKANTNWLKVKDRYLYPMLVWAIKNKKPVLVFVSPGKKNPVKVIKNFSSECMAYIICAALRDC